MKISESTYTVSKNGALKIPSAELSAMGLFPGMHVRVAFLSEDGEKNTFREFMLSQKSLSELDTEQRFLIPAELLQQAGIPEDADVQLVAENGMILIRQEPVLTVQELEAVAEALGITNELACELPEDILEASDQLEQALYDFMDKENERNERNGKYDDAGKYRTQNDCC